MHKKLFKSVNLNLATFFQAEKRFEKKKFVSFRKNGLGIF